MPSPPPDPTLTDRSTGVFRTVTTEVGPGVTISADVYDPLATDRTQGASGSRIAVLMLHGGRWRLGDRSMMRLRAEALAAHGFVVISADYRLLGDAPWPAQLEDSKAWVRWIRGNAADLGVSPSRVAVLGCSAGGHLALLCGSSRAASAGSSDSRPSAIIAMYPPTELRGEAQAMLLGADADVTRVDDASPIAHVSPDFPPTLFVHGLADTMVPPASSQRMHEALVAAGAASELHLFEGQMHEFESAPTYAAVVQHLVAVFLNRSLLDPDAFEAEQQAHNPIASGSPPGVGSTADRAE